VTDETDLMSSSWEYTAKNDNGHAQNENLDKSVDENNDEKQPQIDPKCVTSVKIVTERVASNIPQEPWNVRIKEVVPRIFGDLKYLGCFSKATDFYGISGRP
jgi:hypothetical protein